MDLQNLIFLLGQQVTFYTFGYFFTQLLCIFANNNFTLINLAGTTLYVVESLNEEINYSLDESRWHVFFRLEKKNVQKVTSICIFHVCFKKTGIFFEML